ncbi:MAG: ABC transporter ATP-binding protein [Natronohydrobacter sp.]|nr:ABC transporter ATP-binding protein [Natronohydrobacter sp.]
MSLSLENIVKRYKSETVLDGVSLDVARGETLVLFGPSGAGKTVLLRLIAGVIDPDEGRIAIGGQDMTGVEPEDRGLGMAFQNFALFPHMDARKNIAAPLTARRMDKASMAETVSRVARMLKIEHVLHHKPKELSNGQKQRTSLARALAAAPDVLLLDDPLRNVDAKLRFEMRLELPRLLKSQGATVIYVTQDYKEAMALGDTIAVLDAGQIHQIGTPEDIYLRPATVEIARLFGDPVINLLDVTPQMVDGRVQAMLSGVAVPLGAAFEQAVGRDCTLGIRAEALKFVPADTAGAIPVTIETEAPLNEKTITLALTRNGREVMISRPATQEAPSMGVAHVLPDPSSLHLFERATGRRIVGAAKATVPQGALQ